MIGMDEIAMDFLTLAIPCFGSSKRLLRVRDIAQTLEAVGHTYGNVVRASNDKRLVLELFYFLICAECIGDASEMV